MKFQPILFLLLVSCISACKQGDAKDTAQTDTASETTGAVAISNEAKLPGASILAFGPDNVLFIGDSKGARIHAVPTEATELKDAVPFNMEGFDIMLAEKLGLAPRDVLINDMKIHPLSQEAYVSVKLGHQPNAESIIAIANPVTADIRFLNIPESSTSVTLNNPASTELSFWKETPASALNLTDIDYHEGYLYAAGLTKSEFASTLRKIAYPFTNDQASVNRIEIYHAVHTQNETRAPIRTMLFDEIEGASTLLASYTCTPLVTIPTKEIQSEADIKGKTIAELGYGNAPIDMITVMTLGMDGSLT